VPELKAPKLAGVGAWFKTVEITAGTTAKLKVATYAASDTKASQVRAVGAWRSASTSVAKVNAAGQVKAKTTGKTVIVLAIEGKSTVVPACGLPSSSADSSPSAKSRK
jgi:hypothetical protein